jgi:hypothetical protein
MDLATSMMAVRNSLPFPSLPLSLLPSLVRTIHALVQRMPGPGVAAPIRFAPSLIKLLARWTTRPYYFGFWRSSDNHFVHTSYRVVVHSNYQKVRIMLVSTEVPFKFRRSMLTLLVARGRNQGLGRFEDMRDGAS